MSDKLSVDEFGLVEDNETLDTVIRLPNGDVAVYGDTSEYRNLAGTLNVERFIREIALPDYEEGIEQ